MRELSFVIKCGDNSQGISEYVNKMFALFGEIDFEVIIVNTSENSLIMDELMGIEKTAPDKVAIVNCGDDIEENKIYDVGLQYSNSACFLLLQSGEVLSSKKISELLYDKSLIGEDKIRFLQTKLEYLFQSAEENRFRYLKINDKACVTDYKDNAGNIDSHYFFQDIYVANLVYKSGIKHICDIGSRIDGYISHLLSMGIGVTMIDIRPLKYKIDGLDFIQGNATELENIEDNSIQYLSCLHALEHFGLGRYGDPVDVNGWKKALNQYIRVLKPNGYLYLSVPVGNVERVEFNAHRIFAPQTIVDCASDGLRIMEFTYFHDGIKTTFDLSRATAEEVKEVLEHNQLTMLGLYDCGIFVFRKE